MFTCMYICILGTRQDPLVRLDSQLASGQAKMTMMMTRWWWWWWWWWWWYDDDDDDDDDDVVDIFWNLKKHKMTAGIIVPWGPGGTCSTAQGGGGSFKKRKPIGEVGCCDSRMAERIHWWTERWFISLTLSLSFALFLSLSLIIYLPTCRSIYLSI